ncbi:hypothetical protein HMPREF1112_1264 [Streptococcus pseudopneumoniae SK674]|nr:hypothetical protein HMPREF1046_0200 [Streptococcus pseudopneumoniae ATCC BAA-960 = CCUG 49455]EID70044.1 hypothetical protein HMPREF1112_1264 [Streptococcus pseudopneumoniae SK674]ETD92518.1 hypothetical protein U752_08640 [Streptococcus pseudopneumoniae 1321]ETE01442.1 hypothetical protein U753_00705 [Streptococcus pseudopneumoniae 5247]
MWYIPIFNTFFEIKEQPNADVTVFRNFFLFKTKYVFLSGVGLF